MALHADLNMEYAIITALLIALIYQTLTKRYWKRRAAGTGFWGLVERQMQINAGKLPVSNEWPDEIER